MNYSDNIKHWQEIMPGHFETVSKTITESDILLWGGITGELEKCYLGMEYNRLKKFGVLTVPPLCVAGLISAAICKLTPNNIYATQNLKFVKPIYVGDNITATATIIEKFNETHMIRISTICNNQNGELVIEGEATQYVLED